MSKGSWKRTGGRVSAVDPEDGDRYHYVDKSPSRLLNSFGVIKFYPSKTYGDNLERILRKKRAAQAEGEQDGSADK